MRKSLAFVFLFFWGIAVPAATPPIKASANKRYLVDQNNVPWMMVGDSAHRMICHVPQSSWAAYFQDRQAQGFNTIDIFVMDGHSPCNGTGGAADGTLPFTSGSGPSSYDISTPNNAFWNEIDAYINQATSYGLVVSIDPAAWGNGFAIMYQNNGATKVFNWGAWLGNRYKNFPNIIWHTGQDFFTPSSSDVNLMAQLMAGIASTDSNHLDMFQAAPGSFSQQFNNQNATFAANLTLDFVYTYREVYDEVLQGYNFTGVLPTILPVIMGESNYETGNNTGALSSPANDFITRQEMWYAMTSGGAGHIFGNEHVNHFDSSYQANLDTAATDGANYSFTYTPVATTLTVNMAKFSKASVTAQWYDPSNGTYHIIAGSPFSNTGTQNFTTPGANGAGANDWVLVLSTSTATAPAPPTNLKATVQ